VPASGAGAACSDVAPCLDQRFAFCAEASNGDRYCTSQGCSKSADCPETYACTKSASGSFCQRTPRGLSADCESDDDCAAFEATLCDTLFSHTCVVQGCSLSPNDCFESWECCDASAFGVTALVCVPEGQCP
jgi:hypothetical protein